MKSDGPSEVAIWGLGRVGTGFALALKDLPISLHLYSSSETSRDRTSALGLRVEPSLEAWQNKAKNAEVIALGWSDDALHQGASKLGDILTAKQTLIHFSGLLNAAVLGSTPAELGSVHPLAACPTPESAVNVFKQGPLVLEGAHSAQIRMRQLVDRLGAKSFEVKEGQKATYHAGAVLASNALVGLLHLASKEWKQAGLEQADELLVSLSESAIRAVAEKGLIDGLTGPLKRGDIGSLERHLAVLSDDTSVTYKALHRALMDLIGEDLENAETRDRLKALLID